MRYGERGAEHWEPVCVLQETRNKEQPSPCHVPCAIRYVQPKRREVIHMKVQGTEPVVMGKVIDIAARQEVKDTKKSAIDMNLQTKKERPIPEENRQQRQSSTDEAVQRMNMTMQALNIRLKFEKHEASGEYIVKVVNEDSQEVIREIPAEKTLDLLVHLRHLVGVLVDERV
ncbi:MAG: flagellar protein FlaG [Bacillota bacterium]|nr:MAG: flagellar protein FlaG [Bacillota bacterium]